MMIDKLAELLELAAAALETGARLSEMAARIAAGRTIEPDDLEAARIQTRKLLEEIERRTAATSPESPDAGAEESHAPSIS